MGNVCWSQMARVKQGAEFTRMLTVCFSSVAIYWKIFKNIYFFLFKIIIDHILGIEKTYLNTIKAI